MRAIRSVIFYFIVFEVVLGIARLFLDPDSDLNLQTYGESSLFHRKSPHPYLGFVTEDFSPLDISSISDREKVFVLTVTGGSVAQEICRFNKADPVLQNTLKQKLNKTVLLNCLAVESYSHPQQSISALLYARHTDFFLSLEGVNELFDTKDPAAPNFPNSRFRKLFFSDFRESFWQRNVLYFLSNTEFWSRSRQSWMDRLSTITFLKSVLRKLDTLYVKRFFYHDEKDVSLDVRLSIWQNSLIDIQGIMAERSTPYVIVLQPQIFDRPVLTSKEQIVMKRWDEFFVNSRNQSMEGARQMLAATENLVWTDWTRNSRLLGLIEFYDDRHFTPDTMPAFSRGLADLVAESYQTATKRPSSRK